MISLMMTPPNTGGAPARRIKSPLKNFTPRFMKSLLSLLHIHCDREPKLPLSRPSATLFPALGGGEGRERGRSLRGVESGETRLRSPRFAGKGEVCPTSVAAAARQVLLNFHQFVCQLRIPAPGRMKTDSRQPG